MRVCELGTITPVLVRLSNQGDILFIECMSVERADKRLTRRFSRHGKFEPGEYEH